MNAHPTSLGNVSETELVNIMILCAEVLNYIAFEYSIALNIVSILLQIRQTFSF